MGNFEILIGLAGLVIAALIYFAGVQRGKRQRIEDYELHLAERANDLNRKTEAEKLQRIQKVVDRYSALVNSGRSSNLNGMLSAGVVGLDSSSEVEEACRRIAKLGLSPAIPETYMNDLSGADLLLFFDLLQKRPDQARCGSGVQQIIREVKGECKA